MVTITSTQPVEVPRCNVHRMHVLDPWRNPPCLPVQGNNAAAWVAVEARLVDAVRIAAAHDAPSQSLLPLSHKELHECWRRHLVDAVAADGVTAALQLPSSHAARVADTLRASAERGACHRVLATVACGTGPQHYCMVLVAAQDPVAFCARCGQDGALARIVDRMFMDCRRDGALARIVDRMIMFCARCGRDGALARVVDRMFMYCRCDGALARVIDRMFMVGQATATSLQELQSKLLALVTAAAATTAAAGAASAPERPVVLACIIASVPLRLPVVRFQACPRSLEKELLNDHALAMKAIKEPKYKDFAALRLHPIDFELVASVVYTQGLFFAGVVPRAAWPGDIVAASIDAHAPCRAFYKLREATDRAGIAYQQNWNALDMGASPGGWTHFLSPRVARVFAVDPGSMDADVLALPNVTYLRAKVQAASERASVRTRCWGRYGARSVLALPNVTRLRAKVQSRCVRMRGGSGARAQRRRLALMTFSSREPHVFVLSTPNVTHLCAKVQVRARGSGGSGHGPNVTHLRAKVQGQQRRARRVDVLAQLPAMDLVVSDMNMAPDDLMQQVEAATAAGVVKDTAMLIMSFKDFCGPDNSDKGRDAQVARAMAALSLRWPRVQLLHLVAGGLRELTVVCRHEHHMAAAATAVAAAAEAPEPAHQHSGSPGAAVCG
ncbi:hypothetical protein JKP88DRAFT_349085 [Tribonema minus]|uniref:Ribosomal RNA methyltransferase FtsJ domain-containing protein n=1 Tax=Tribonema minus TaxID=303371 RepID=A0A835YXR4_9STRA|nr:hypothetical protein JKP88DRAFT_349085 [Tribonema minus]